MNRPLLSFQLALLQREKFSEVILVMDSFEPDSVASCNTVEAFVKQHNAKVSLLRVVRDFVVCVSVLTTFLGCGATGRKY